MYIKVCLDCIEFFGLSDCNKCHKNNSLVLNVRYQNNKDIFELIEVKELNNKIDYWKSKINEAKYHIKNRQKDISKLKQSKNQKQLNKLIKRGLKYRHD